MLYILFAIVMFGLLIFVHEGGHFTAAKLLGVKVEEFSLGMGPTLWKKQGKETLYSVRAFPIGGFCAMEGEDEDTGSPTAFAAQKGWKKLIILVAGAGMNFLLGLALLIGLYATAAGFGTSTIEKLAEGCPAEGILQSGDTILAVNGERLLIYSDFTLLLSRGNGESYDLTIRRNGEKLELEDVPIYQKEYVIDGQTVTQYGYYFRTQANTPLRTISYAGRSALDFVRMVFFSLEELFSGRAGLSDMAGPIGIVSVMSEVGEASASRTEALENLIYFAAFITVNLAVMNLLPIPALDGGRVFFLLVNGLYWLLTRRKVDPKYEGYVHGAGMVLLLALMAVVALSDIARIAGGGM